MGLLVESSGEHTASTLSSYYDTPCSNDLYSTGYPAGAFHDWRKTIGFDMCDISGTGKWRHTGLSGDDIDGQNASMNIGKQGVISGTSSDGLK